MLTNLVSTVAGITVIVLFIVAVVRFCTRPRFMLFVVPEEGKLPDRGAAVVESAIDEFRLHESGGIPRLRSEKKFDSPDVKARSVSREVVQGYAEIPIILQNVGRRDSGYLKVIFRFSSPRIRLVDLSTEAATVESFYGQDQEVLESSELKRKNPDSRIRGYYASINMIADYLSLETTLSAGGMEMFVFRIRIPEDLKQFGVVIRLECRAIDVWRQVWAHWFTCNQVA